MSSNTAEIKFGSTSDGGGQGKIIYDKDEGYFTLNKQFKLANDSLTLEYRVASTLQSLRNLENRLDNLGFKLASINVINNSYIDAENTEIYALGKILYGRIAIKIPTIYKNDGAINLKIADFKNDLDGNSMLLPHADINLKVAVQYMYAGGAGNTYKDVTYGEVKIKTNGEIWFSVTIPLGASTTSSAAYTLLCDNYLNKIF